VSGGLGSRTTTEGAHVWPDVLVRPEWETPTVPRMVGCGAGFSLFLAARAPTRAAKNSGGQRDRLCSVECLAGASDDIAPGGPRGRGVRTFLIQTAILRVALDRDAPTMTRSMGLTFDLLARRLRWGRRESNSHGPQGPRGSKPGCLPVPARPHLSVQVSFVDRVLGEDGA